MSERIIRESNKVQRHGFSGPFVHWTVVLSGIALVFSGFGQMPMYKRYGISGLPGLTWSADYSVTLMVHYVAATVLMFAVAYHVAHSLLLKKTDILPRRGDVRESIVSLAAMFGLGKEPKSDKYHAKQRLAYAYIAFWMAMIILTGIIKVIKNLPAVYLPASSIWLADNLHTLATFMLIFGVAAHLGAFLFKQNRPLIWGMFTGKVDLDYVKHHHALWYERLVEKEKRAPQKESTTQ
ncbi:MAG: cytochrome b/b6 domain-containing protein [Bacillota bacterium]|uniref:formate dehydrogenase subunit gamma n=1 Tax=Desulforudis sp. DRI-14 TaxID=3459793 RepID=UPI00346BADC9